MNQKTAKTIRLAAKETAQERGWNPRRVYKDLKKLWLATPKNLKHTLGF